MVSNAQRGGLSSRGSPSLRRSSSCWRAESVMVVSILAGLWVVVPPRRAPDPIGSGTAGSGAIGGSGGGVSPSPVVQRLAVVVAPDGDLVPVAGARADGLLGPP